MAIAVPGRRPQLEAPRPLTRAIATLRRYPMVPGAILLVLLVVPSLFAEVVALHSPTDASLHRRLDPPAWEAGGSWEYPLGTDKQGRDILSRIVHGARVSLAVSLLSIFFGGVIGTSLGLIAGYLGGKLEHFIMRLVDISFALPSIMIALVLVTIIGPGFVTVIVAIVATLWDRYARLVRGLSLSIKHQDFIARARVAGASNSRILLRHVLPNVANPIIVLGTLEIGYVILLESTLSFLGAGLNPPTPAWGLMVADGRELIVAAWWVAFFPGLAIMITVLSLNLLGDWLRDRLDPKQRNV